MHVLEEGQLLSRSKLWTLLKQMYEDQALNAWQGIGTPFYLTSTPLLAHGWADLAFQFFRELHESGLDGPQPWTLMEVGAGSGRFAYLFLCHFEKLHRAYFSSKNMHEHPWRYLMFDISPPMVEFWRTHPYFARFLKAGNLDFGTLDLLKDGEVVLENSNDLLAPGCYKAPCVVMGGYIFDSMPSEAFIKLKSGIAPMTWTVRTPHDSEEVGLSSIVESMEYEWTPSNVREEHALSSNTYLPKLWEYYRKHLKNNQAFTLPCAALQAIDRLRQICRGGMLLLAADQGYGDIASIESIDKIEMGRHGSTSCPVNYDGLARLLNFEGQIALVSSTPEYKFVQMVAFLDGAQSSPVTQYVAKKLLDDFDNENYWRLFDQVLDLKARDPQLIYLLLKLGKWDPVNFFHLQPLMQKHWDTLESAVREHWLVAIENVIGLFFPLGDGDEELLNQLAALSVKLGSWSLGIKAWNLAASFRPHRADIQFNLGVAYYQLDEKNLAMQAFLIAEKLDPNYSLQARGLI